MSSVNQLLQHRRMSLNVFLRASRCTATLYHTLVSPAPSPRRQEKSKLLYHLKNNKNSLCIVSRGAAATKPKAVIFDLGGVVVPSPQSIFDRFEEKHSLGAGSLVATIKATGNGGAFAKMERGEYTVEQFCVPFRSEYLSHANRELSLEQVQEFIQQLSDFTQVTPHPGVVEMFGKLRSHGIKVAILTNNFRRDNGCTVFPDKELENVDVVSP